MKSEGQSFIIVQRVGTLPVVASAFGSLSTFYQRSKESSALVKFTLEKAETGMHVVAKTAAPVVTKLEKPIGRLDEYACSKLDVIEEKYPIIKAPAEEFISETYGAVKQYGANKLGSFLPKVDPILDYADRTVDYYMPAVGDEKKEFEENKEEDEKDSGPTEKVVAISTKVRRRMFIQAMNQVRNVKRRSAEAIDRLKHTVNLIEYAKAVDGKVRYVWNEIQKNEEEVENDHREELNNKPISNAETIEKRIIATARHLTIQLKRTISSFSTVKVLPPAVSGRLSETRKLTDDFYWSLSHVCNHAHRSSQAAVNHCSTILKTFKLEDVPQKALENARLGLVKVQDNVNYITDYLLQLIIPDYNMDGVNVFDDFIEFQPELNGFAFTEIRYVPHQ
ncbi:DgyrCDS13836 [Dimorphilus gyrociliatus]|uniref:DgyrCDS13836 n=1 Tax=Dimorphilus gyrociliatus TaxID=2664684 RepID=A0A7I8WBU2_9ANNE|nr:DgyrCDS13836 [Dimorphilus gyrociliatus]